MSHLDRKPTVPLLLLGPKNSGKSKLLETILEQESSRMLYLDLGQKKPIIVIDEANALTLWKILATSENFLVSWLESQGFDENVRRDEVLGDLTSAEAFVTRAGTKV
ncbi:hypothetical protein Ndes2437A_g05880 [Nannochloris sp. 'desiccata']